MENEDNKSRKQLLAFCAAFPQDLPVELKQTFSSLLNSTLASIDRIVKNAEINTWNLFAEGRIFSFREKENSYDIFHTFQYVMRQYQQGKDPSIAYGIPHYGFDLVFIEVQILDGQDTIGIIDSYLLQNAFITNINHNHGVTDVSLKGFYAQNASVAELAKNMIEQNIKAAQAAQQVTEV